MAKQVLDPKENYNEIIKYNLEVIDKGEYNKYIDPDKTTKYNEKISDLDILIAQDGLCSFNAIVKFSKGEEIKKNYSLIRENMFDCLVWPAYAMSINQMRAIKFKDRIDLLLSDIKNFYDIVNKDTELTLETVNKIWQGCELARAYIFPQTFYWLRGFEDFTAFLDKRKLKIFWCDEDGKSVWSDVGDGFTKTYFDRLLQIVNKKREQEKINVII